MDTDHRKLYRVKLEYQAFCLVANDQEAATLATSIVEALDPMQVRVSVVQRVNLTEVELADTVWMEPPEEEDEFVTVRQCLVEMAKEGRR